jgi:hypothetical protein
MTLLAQSQWLTSIIQAIQKAEIRRITVQDQPRKIVRDTLSQKYPIQKRSQVEECQPSKLEALNLNSSTTKKIHCFILWSKDITEHMFKGAFFKIFQFPWLIYTEHSLGSLKGSHLKDTQR